MAAIGNSPTQQAFTPAIDYFSGNGSTTAFTLSRPVASVAQVQVVIDNVAQNPSSAYTVSSNTITFTSAPLSGTNNIYVYYTSPITQVIAPGQSTVGLTALNATGTASSSTYLRGDNSWATVASPSAATPTVLGTVYGNTPSATTSAFLGYQAGDSNTGIRNVGMGNGSLFTNSSGSYQTAIGYQTLYSNTTSNENSALGYQASYSNTTGSENVAVGSNALYTNSTGASNVAIGRRALYANTGSNNTAVGHTALTANTTGANNVSIGAQSLITNTVSSYNVAIGYQAGYSHAVTSPTNAYGTYLGAFAGYAVTTGVRNTFLGNNSGAGVTTGSDNTIIGGYQGSGAPISATGSNYIVLSDGVGNARLIINGSTGYFQTGLGASSPYNATTASAANVNIFSDGALYRSTSALKYKQDIRDIEEIDINLLRGVRYKSKCKGDDQTKDHFGIVADEVDAAGIKELVSYGAEGEVEGFQYERLTVVLLKSLQETKALNNTQAATITALTARITALENK
jgi:hypothetical protein